MDEEQFNPKFGLTWSPFPGTTLRGAAFRSLKRSLLSDQTIEPTQVAGFNQFFDDGNGADVWNYGIGIDQSFSSDLYAGAEFYTRDLEERGITGPSGIREFDSEEDFFRVYTYWTPNQWLALGPDYQFERFRNPLEFSKDEQITGLDTHRVSLAGTFFHPFGLIARLRVTYVDQDGEFVVPSLAPEPEPPFITTMTDSDQFWVVDASIGYRLPNRRGHITVEGKNLFDEKFSFQDTDPSNPQIYPERLILAKFTLVF
jgi:outer membrane receptor protein involved in Fe transport